MKRETFFQRRPPFKGKKQKSILVTATENILCCRKFEKVPFLQKKKD